MIHFSKKKNELIRMRKAHASKYIQKLTFIVVREFDGRALALPVPLPVSRPIPEREGYRHVEIVG